VSAKAHTVIPTASQAVLVAECVTGSPQAWSQLWRVYYPIAGAFLRKMGVREPDLEDTCQNVFVQMVRYLAEFRGESDLKTWLYRICLSEARELRRKGRLRRVLMGILASQPQRTAGLELSEGLARRRVQEALDRLKPHDRAVFVLYEMEGLNGEQIAAIEGCPVATVWRRLHYARAAFKQHLTEEGGTP
jgi:RNA polymerase sigma-70 factor (ECF subfamily)